MWYQLPKGFFSLFQCSRGQKRLWEGSQQHGPCAGDDQDKPQPGLGGQLLLEDGPGEEHRHQDAQFVDGHHHAGQAVLQGPVIAQPRKPCGHPGQKQEHPAPFLDGADALLLSRNKDHSPGHDEHHNGADGRAQVGLHVFHAYLPENGGQAGKHRRETGIYQPGLSLGLGGICLLFCNHQQGACADGRHPQGLRQGDRLPQEQESQQDGEHGAGLVNGGHLVHVPQLQGPEVAQPGGPGGQAGQDQKQQSVSGKAGDLSLGAHHEHHQPGEPQHHNGAQGCGQGGVDVLHTDFRQYRRNPGEKCRTKREQDPNHPASPVSQNRKLSRPISYSPTAGNARKPRAASYRSTGESSPATPVHNRKAAVTKRQRTNNPTKKTGTKAMGMSR